MTKGSGLIPIIHDHDINTSIYLSTILLKNCSYMEIQEGVVNDTITYP